MKCFVSLSIVIKDVASKVSIDSCVCLFVWLDSILIIDKCCQVQKLERKNVAYTIFTLRARDQWKGGQVQLLGFLVVGFTSPADAKEWIPTRCTKWTQSNKRTWPLGRNRKTFSHEIWKRSTWLQSKIENRKWQSTLRKSMCRASTVISRNDRKIVNKHLFSNAFFVKIKSFYSKPTLIVVPGLRSNWKDAGKPTPDKRA